MINKDTMSRYLNNKRNDYREIEADNFAGELLRPPIPFILAGSNSAYDIACICHITSGASNVGYKKLMTLRDKINNPKYYNDFYFYYYQFHDFIYSHYCPTCHNVFIDETANFCPICGDSKIQWFNSNLSTFIFLKQNRGDSYIMRYYMPASTPPGILTKCLRCDNEDIKENHYYCMICGSPLQNKCFGAICSNPDGETWFDTDKACGAELPPNARFCPYCGSASLFYSQNLLCDWQEEFNKKGIDDLPF